MALAGDARGNPYEGSQDGSPFWSFLADSQSTSDMGIWTKPLRGGRLRVLHGE